VEPASGRARKTFPAALAALVITRVVYTASEARRRQAEDDALWGAFRATELDVDDWLLSRVGKKRLAQEVEQQAKGRQQRQRGTFFELCAFAALSRACFACGNVGSSFQ
jgi:hypothetical protein